MSSVPTDQGNVLPVLIVLPQTDLVMLFRVIFGTGSFETFAASKFTMHYQLYILTNFSEAVDWLLLYLQIMFVIWRNQREISRYGALMKDKLSMSNSYKWCSVRDRVNVKVSTFHSLVSGQGVLGPKCPEPTARSLTWLMDLFVSWAPGLHRFCGTTDTRVYTDTVVPNIGSVDLQFFACALNLLLMYSFLILILNS